MNISLIHKYPKPNIQFPTYEPVTTKWVLDNVKEDWICLDCGANIGYYTIMFSKCAPKGIIHAFEPTDTFEMLKKNCKENNCDNIIYHKIALGNKDGIYKEKVYKIWGTPPEDKEFDFVTLDTFCKQHKINNINLIKIDVDSFDYEVVEGATKILTELSPLVFVELNQALHLRNKKPKDVINLMDTLNYENINVFDENFLFKKR